MQRSTFLDSVFERTATRFLRRIHRVTHGTPVKLRAVEKQRVLVVAPHPDDEVIAVGGTLALHQRAGSEVLTLFVTLDAPAADGSIVRKGEAERAGRLLGFEPRFLGFPDGSCSETEPSQARFPSSTRSWSWSGRGSGRARVSLGGGPARGERPDRHAAIHQGRDEGALVGCLQST